MSNFLKTAEIRRVLLLKKLARVSRTLSIKRAAARKQTVPKTGVLPTAGVSQSVPKTGVRSTASPNRNPPAEELPEPIVYRVDSEDELYEFELAIDQGILNPGVPIVLCPTYDAPPRFRVPPQLLGPDEPEQGWVDFFEEQNKELSDAYDRLKRRQRIYDRIKWIGTGLLGVGGAIGAKALAVNARHAERVRKHEMLHERNRQAFEGYKSKQEALRQEKIRLARETTHECLAEMFPETYGSPESGETSTPRQEEPAKTPASDDTTLPKGPLSPAAGVTPSSITK